MATGFNFGGAKSTAVPTFGTSSLTFAAPGAQQQPQMGFGGLQQQQPIAQSSLFGAPAATTAGFKPTGFGAPTSAPASGFGFGGTAAVSASTAPSSGFGNMAPSAPAAGFGVAASTTASGFAFGSTPAATTAVQSGLSFGAPAASATTSAAPSLGFGLPATTTTSMGLSFGAPATTSIAPTGLSFGTAATTTGGGLFGSTTSAPSLGLSFAAPSTAPSLTTGSLSFGGLGGVSSATTCLPGFSLTTTTTPQQSVGLGGIPSSQTKSGAATTAQKEIPPKEQQLPNEFLQLVDQFKNVVQEEKTRSSDVARCSVKEFHKVETELDLLNQHFSQVENQLQNNRNLAEQLKFDTARGLQNIEMAQRTQDTPPSLQYDNSAPLQFFLDLAENFEKEMQNLKQKIDNTEKFVKKCHEPTILTSQDLAVGMKRLHDTFVALAGRMQAVHSQVENQKEMFLSIRKQAIKDNLNPFEKLDKHTELMNTVLSNALKTNLPSLATGPTPFNSITLGSNNLALATQQTPPPTYPSTTTALGLDMGATFGTQGAGSFLNPPGFGASQPFQGFQLQNPPVGNKRGKQ